MEYQEFDSRRMAAAVAQNRRLAGLPPQGSEDKVNKIVRVLYKHMAWAYKWRSETEPYETLNEHAKEVLDKAAIDVLNALVTQ